MDTRPIHIGCENDGFPTVLFIILVIGIFLLISYFEYHPGEWDKLMLEGLNYETSH